MSARGTVARLFSAPEEWNRRRLQVALAFAAVVLTAAVGGIVWSVIVLLNVGGDFTGGSGTAPDVEHPASPTTAPIEFAEPGPLSPDDSGSIEIPQPGMLGEVQVGTGFPRTPRGALAQLIAIDQRAVQSASVVTAQDVIDAWAAPGGPTATTWSGVAAVRALLESAGLPGNGSPDLVIQLDPAMGLVDSNDGMTTVCVDFVVTATVTGRTPNRIASADCQHMVWQDGRWLIAPGEEAPAMPSLWPGTQASYDVGFRWLEVEP